MIGCARGRLQAVRCAAARRRQRTEVGESIKRRGGVASPCSSHSRNLLRSKRMIACHHFLYPIQPGIRRESRAVEVQCNGPQGSGRRQLVTSDDCSEGAVLLSWSTWPCLKSNPFLGSHQAPLHGRVPSAVPAHAATLARTAVGPRLAATARGPEETGLRPGGIGASIILHKEIDHVKRTCRGGLRVLRARL